MQGSRIVLNGMARIWVDFGKGIILSIFDLLNLT